MRCLCLILLALGPGISALTLQGKRVDRVNVAANATLSKDCWKRRPVIHHRSAFLEKHPGHGFDEKDVAPFELVYMDGYMYVDCVKDGLKRGADKHGPGKPEYEEEHSTNVSIVWYDRIVPKEDREAMTPAVCFNFCRTVGKTTQFFGLVEGRKCYCSPYFIQEAGDSSQCDAVCEGDNKQMCGGMKKQGIYAMHFCDRLAEHVEDAKTAADLSHSLCENVSNAYLFKQETLQALGKGLRARAGQAGDTITNVHGASASKEGSEAYKVHSRALAVQLDLGNASEKLVSDALTDSGDAKDDEGHKEWDLQDADVVKGLEKNIAVAKNLVKEAAKTCGPFEEGAFALDTTENADPDVDDVPHIQQYLPITYWIEDDKATDHVNMTGALASTCAGINLKDESVTNGFPVRDAEQCAEVCDTFSTDGGGNRCLAFEYYKPADEDHGLCIMLNDIKEISYYKKDICGDEGESGGEERSQGLRRRMLLQKKDAKKRSASDKVLLCAAKFSLMTGFGLRLKSKAAGVDHVPVNALDRCF